MNFIYYILDKVQRFLFGEETITAVITAKGKVKLDCYREGQLAWSTGWINNTITNAGKAQVALLAGDASAVPFTYIAVGTSNTAPAATQTALQAEITDTGLARAAGTFSRTTTTVTNDTYNLTYTWSVSGSKTVEEVGIFNASSSGTMLGRALTSSKSLVNGDSLIGTYQVKFA